MEHPKINIATSKSLNDKHHQEEKQEPDYISYDAPPLDFSFKNIKNIEELKNILPRQGEKKKQAGFNKEDKASKIIVQEKQDHEAQGEEEGENKGEKKKNEVVRLLPQNNISSVVANLANTSAMKNISLKAKEQLQKKKKKAVYVKLICASVMLSYNKIRSISGLNLVLSCVMDNLTHLQWVDLSHNYLTALDYNFQHLPHFKTLYLHSNYLIDLSDLQPLKIHHQLKTLTVHGNPLASLPNFRVLTISILPDLKKLDSVLISKKQRDNAIFIRSQIKKYPQVKNPAKPPIEKEEDEEEEKE